MEKKRSLLSEHPDVASEWHPTKNGELTPDDVTPMSGRKVWWLGKCGHEWSAVISSRTNGSKCPFCAHKALLIGFNDLATTNPELAKQWNYERNGELKPTDLMAGSGRVVWWKCSLGHEWSARVLDRTKGSGCPFCSNHTALAGYNDLDTSNPELAKQWNYNKNGYLKPTDVTAGSNKKVWWICKEGHEWQATVACRTTGDGCPYCSGRFAAKGENDLQTINPALAKEWNYEKNKGLTPSDVLPNSSKKVWWKCIKGHEWQTSVYDRSKGNGCPFCGNKRVMKGYNDLQTVNPALAKEWNYEKNNGLTPADVLPNSRKKVWWVCSKGHEWQANIYQRNTTSGCPVCHSERNTSLPEFALIYYLRKSGLEVIHSFKDQCYELDVYIPSKQTAIEFDGYFWHKNKTEKDLEKNRYCEKEGIKLYRIREGLPALNDSSIDYSIQKDHKDISRAYERMLHEIVGKRVDIDLNRDAIDIENLREYIEKEGSVLFSNPEVAREWNYERNGRLRPEHVLPNSGKKVWWKCSKGHEWQARIENRCRGIGCPYCAGRFAITGQNDLQTVNPDLAKEWDYEKNDGLTPIEVLPNSEKKVWWKCQNGHSWQAIIGNRSKGQGCPYCSGRRVLKGFNDLQTKNPLLSSEWNYAKNNGLRPEDVTPNSNKKVWWKCSKGHEWQAKVCDRNKGNGCPYCGGKRVSIGFNDLQTVNPKLASEWNYEKNAGLTPKDVTPSCNKKVWWKCSKGHEWEAFIYNRNKGNNCPYCANKRKDTRSTKSDQ